jgi:signal transduction histidine kinase/DNA-binding response OmpR family regulator/ligand-binding sensor domain-containing protein
MNENVRYLVCAAFFATLQVNIYCQKFLDPEYYPPDIRWDNFLLKGGEASQETISILIDSKGFLWSGNETGLYRFDGTRYIEYGVSNGTRSGFKGFFVSSIFEDSEGTIWIGTSEALNKLDQKAGTFKYYIPDSVVKSEISNYIRAIREDRNGLLWILTKKDIYSFDRKSEEFKLFTTDSLSWFPANITYIPEDQCYTEDNHGNKWFVTFSGLYLFNNQDKSFRMELPDPDNNLPGGIDKVKCVCTDKNGTVWIGTEGAGLLRWNDNGNKPVSIEGRTEGKRRDSFKTVSTILADKNGSIWMFGNCSFSNYNPENGKIKNYIINYKNKTVYESPVSEVFIDQAFQFEDGTIWFISKLFGLMFRFDPITEKLYLYRSPSFVVFQCILDKTGSFWCACIRNNIFRLITDHIPFLTIPVNNSSHVAPIHRGNIVEDNQNQIYFLFLQGIYICNKFDVSSALILSKFRFPDGDTIAGGGFTDRKGNLWFGNKQGKITRYDPLNKIITNLKYGYSTSYTDVVFVPLIREDKAGNIWVVTYNGLFRVNRMYDKLDYVLELNAKQGEQDLSILFDFLIDGQETLWILTSESILSIKIPEMKITDYAGYGNGIFRSIESNIRVGEDSKGNIFILNTRNGVYQFNRQNKSFTKIDIIKEEPGSQYYDLFIDRTDRLWIAHNRGITVYDLLEKDSHLIKMPKLQNDVQAYQTKSGNIIYVNNDQLYIFYENIPLNKNVPPVYLTRLLINGTDYNKIFTEGNDVSSIKELNLPFNQNSLSIEFAALNYLNPERNQYRYFMEGFDRDTTLTGQGFPAEFKNMPPGRYRFWVTGSNNDGLWNPSGVSLDIRIHPPWYRSVLAYIIYILAAISSLTAYIRIRTYRLTRDKMRLKAEIEKATAELESKNLQLAEIDRIKTHFFTDISHEIRTPLSMILGPLEIIEKEEMLNSRMTGMIDLMKRNSQRLMHLVNQLLDISKLDAGKMKITLVEDDIIKCLRILVYEFLSLAESKHIKYLADLPENPFNTLFDRDKIEKIISNLLTNAFKYTPQKGEVQCIVRIEYDESKNLPPLLKVRVLDSGPGISEEHQPRIFDRFYRIEGHHETGGHGTGIGLSLVQEFVSLLKGEIKVNSIKGKGSDFSITIPLGKDHLSIEEYILMESPTGITDKQLLINLKHQFDSGPIKRDQESKETLLIIEDNDDLRIFIGDSLKGKYIIHEAENGKVGINIAFTMMPDLIVTDIMMPGLDGIQLCNQLKNDERTSHIPVILLTAKATTEDKIAGLQSGADDYIVKPFNMAELSTRISNLLEIRDKLRLKYDKLHFIGSGKWIAESVDDKFMVRVLKTVDSNLRYPNFDVGSLQEQIGMSKTHLTRKLKILTGLTPGLLIRNIRLEKAAEMLKKSAGNITEIANSVGISNPSNFTKSFRKYFGVSPKDYSKH